MPIDDIIAIARQIAEGLEAAHERGIIHRDLKPANVRVTPDGSVKILDFGLAKALGHEGRSGADGECGNHRSSHATTAGMIVGTAAYMAPEQARGKPVDKRADIWAFGVLLYEMLSRATPVRRGNIERHARRRPDTGHRLSPACRQRRLPLIRALLSPVPANET